MFDVMPQRDVASYNAMLSGYALSGVPEELGEGRRLFDAMPVRDTISWNTMVGGYVGNKMMEEAMALFESMPDARRDVVTWNAVINGFFNVGDAARAMELFGRMPVRDAGSLCTVVKGLVNSGNLKEAEEILIRFSVGIDGAIDAYNTLIAEYGKRKMVEEARTLFYLIPRTSPRFKKNLITWNTMMMCYVKSGDLVSARELFEGMSVRDIFSWNTMINGYVQAKEMDEAVSLFEKLHEPDSWSWNMIICGLTRKGELSRAQDFFERMPCKSVVSWNAMIAGYEKNGEYEAAIILFSRMQKVGRRPDKHTLSSVLSVCSGLASFRLGIQIHQLVSKRIVPDVTISNALITMYSRCGAVMHAKDVFVEIAEQKRDVVSWNAMIGGLARHGHAREALELFRVMKRVKVRPTYITFISVLNACGHTGLVDEGRRQFDSMVQEFGLTPGVEHYALLVDLMGRHGQLEEAMRVIEEMTVPPEKSVWGALLNAARVHSDARVAKVAAEALAKVEPEGSAAYVMLYNAHADESRWDDALKVMDSMHRSGIVKQPGYSWIEIESGVHRFLAGDRSHPCSFEIYSLLQSCSSICREIYALT
ncbi:uncharacterized protein A4U43_C08F24320 [Asparagus officinalis]|uniref:pentatricopeptide repeat-containing protein At1g62260, mitochondrial n=1 Tax=Asparagus officinalis TaxID=4686 RepID=UPI00098E4EB3|nr:pentatricopeptide repeat-containing protein At1g62260, mitochondrial [Asparagus officinalis]ONK60938.1 uncharacterized protein A4U43_C08F24320 [Asparagus officinalis]